MKGQLAETIPIGRFNGRWQYVQKMDGTYFEAIIWILCTGSSRGKSPRNCGSPFLMGKARSLSPTGGGGGAWSF